MKLLRKALHFRRKKKLNLKTAEEFLPRKLFAVLRKKTKAALFWDFTYCTPTMSADALTLQMRAMPWQVLHAGNISAKKLVANSLKTAKRKRLLQ